MVMRVQLTIYDRRGAEREERETEIDGEKDIMMKEGECVT